MLNEYQIKQVWESLLFAETRSLYFADLACSYSRRKQIITGLSFFMSSGAAATVIGKFDWRVPAGLALVSAAATAYSIAVGLDRKVGTMAKLHSSWNSIAAQYERLWNHHYEDNAESVLEDISRQASESSALATTEAPNNQELIGQWQQRVYAMRHVAVPSPQSSS